MQLLAQDVGGLGRWKRPSRKGQSGLLLDEFLDGGADAAWGCAQPLAIGAIQKAFDRVTKGRLLMDLVDRSANRVDVPGRDWNGVLAQKVEQACLPRVVAAMLEDGVQAVARQAAQEQQKSIGGAVNVGQENQSGGQWPTVQVARSVKDEEPREMDGGQPGERDDRIVGRVLAGVFQKRPQLRLMAVQNFGHDGDRCLRCHHRRPTGCIRRLRARLGSRTGGRS